MGELTTQVGMAAMKNPDEVGAASVDYLMYSGYIILGYLWLRMALVANFPRQKSASPLPESN